MLLVLLILSSTCLCTCQVQKCPIEARYLRNTKVYPARYVLGSRFNSPFIAHIRFNVTKPQRLFVDSAMDLSQAMSGIINDDQQFVLIYSHGSSFETSIPIPITYNKVHSITFAVSPTFFTDINVSPNQVIRSPSILIIHSFEVLTLWYKNIFK